jgi:hypothetical protein
MNLKYKESNNLKYVALEIKVTEKLFIIFLLKMECKSYPEHLQNGWFIKCSWQGIQDSSYFLP